MPSRSTACARTPAGAGRRSLRGHRGQQPSHGVGEGAPWTATGAARRPRTASAAGLSARCPARPASPPSSRGPHDAPAVPLAGERGHRVRADVDAAVDAPGQMDAEEGEGGVGNRVDQAAHQLRAGPARSTRRGRARSASPGSSPASRAIRRSAAPRSSPATRSARLSRPRCATATPRPGGGRSRTTCAPYADRPPRTPRRAGAATAPKSHDPGRADMDRGQAPHLGLVLGDLGGAQLPHRNAVLPAALDEGVQSGQLVLLRGDDQLAGDRVRDVRLRAELRPSRPRRAPRTAPSGSRAGSRSRCGSRRCCGRSGGGRCPAPSPAPSPGCPGAARVMA